MDRKYNINEGLRKGTIIKDQIIGYEGAALSSDNLIALSTEWLKPDGTDFPVSTDTASSDYGYTGRVAFLSGDNQIVSGSNVGVAQFPIKPANTCKLSSYPMAPTLISTFTSRSAVNLPRVNPSSAALRNQPTSILPAYTMVN